MEQLGVNRLKVEHYTKQAAKLDRMKYGDGESRASVGGVGGITIIIGSVQVPSVEDHSGVTIEQNVSENSQLQSV
jgi:hypothetical protein